ncbi:GNAT family N-acetyltransferase [Chryseobacterium sp. YR221]|uniref:GNAT family N-acetyltransferase n=1 Tax=Chryseobacterium sp. YR221 TaxID=1500293 RepID=UPI000A00A6FB|nr:GNAT family N-acetyltransferase [Chryseobacterium sp. YR221]
MIIRKGNTADLADMKLLFAETITDVCKEDYNIDLLFVHKDYQHQGIAKALYTQIEQEALQQEASILNADVSKTAKPFFEKMGFKVNAEQTVHLKGVDLINYKMSKNLIT